MGKDVESWLEKKGVKAWLGDSFTGEIIYLPHPSGRTRDWYTTDNKKKGKIEKNIKELIRVVARKT